MVVSGCSVEPETSTASKTAPSAAVLASTELFEVFVKTCLTHFPDSMATKAAFNRAGLRTIPLDKSDRQAFGEELGRFENSDEGVFGGFGPIIYELSEDYDGSPIPTKECVVSAEIADTDADWPSLLTTLPKRYPDLNWTQNSKLGLSFNRDGASLVVRVQPQGFEGPSLSVELLESLGGLQ
jgi:hypothetical protein